jgi:hypothetical protein
MSPRNDTFLSLCLTQAALSSLHYRHGSIIVRGGKVIGQGFNSYRHGFDGGALKTGILPSNSLDGPAIVELKRRLESKPKHKSKSKSDNHQENSHDSGTFTTSESMGCGHNSNTLLSMHSEMMAIRSALSLSSGALSSQTSARATKCWQKPCFKLSGGSKKRNARSRALKAYAQAVCEEAESRTGKSHGGKFCLQKQSFEPGTSQSGVQAQRQQVQRQGGQGGSRRGEGALGGEDSKKHRETPNDEEWVRGSVQRSPLSSPGSTEALST